jgi:outer membrane receptor for ferrienterochelin and colicin
MTTSRNPRLCISAALFPVLVTASAISSSVLAQEDAQVLPQFDFIGQTDDSGTIVYPASFFAPYNPNSASDMLDRIPGVSIGGGGGGRQGGGGGGGGGGGRGLGTSGDLLINGQRLAGKDNSPRDQLNRIAAREVERIEIIRGTSAELDVRGAGQVVNIVLVEAPSRSSTSVELVGRLNRDNTAEAGGSIAHNRQIGNFQALVNFEFRPNYENRDHREIQYDPAMRTVGTLFETTVRDQDHKDLSANMSYRTGSQRMQLNLLHGDSGHPRYVVRDFVDLRGDSPVNRIEHEDINADFHNWEIGGDYEYSFAGNQRLQMLFIANDQTRDEVRERFDVQAGTAQPSRFKNLYLESNQRTRERIGQGSYSFPLVTGQDLRVGVERADTRLDSSLFIGTRGGSVPGSDRYGGLSPRPELSNVGTTVQELRYEGFLFHNWAMNDRMSLESSLVYETSEISQSGVVDNSRRLNYWRPWVDYRFNLTDSLRIRATVARSVSQLSFAAFAATARNDDREQDADAGNPELVPEQEIRYELGFEFRLPNDSGVVNTRLFYRDIDDYIGRINATTNPAIPLSAIGNIGSAARWGVFNDFSLRLGVLGVPDAIMSGTLNVFDSKVTDPFLGSRQRINRRGEAALGFRHDVTAWSLSYGVDYRYPFHGGEYDIDITSITRNDQQPNLSLFLSKVLFNNVTFRLESDNTLDQSRCRERRRYDGTTINGSLRLIEDSCSSRYRRLTMRVQTTF